MPNPTTGKEWTWEDRCPCGCGQTLGEDFKRRYSDEPRQTPSQADLKKQGDAMWRLLRELEGRELDTILLTQPQDEGFGEEVMS